MKDRVNFELVFNWRGLFEKSNKLSSGRLKSKDDPNNRKCESNNFKHAHRYRGRLT